MSWKYRVVRMSKDLNDSTSLTSLWRLFHLLKISGVKDMKFRKNGCQMLLPGEKWLGGTKYVVTVKCLLFLQDKTSFTCTRMDLVDVAFLSAVWVAVLC